MSDSQNTRSPCDPGWNDPPKLSYNPENPLLKPRNALNKRVPFSLNGASAQSPISVNKPPITQLPVAVPPSIATIDNASHIIKPSQEEIRPNDEDVSENFTQTIDLLNKIAENNSETIKKCDDIKKRIIVMETMWKENKLNKDIEQKMSLLAKALSDSDSKSADAIHKSLMIDHVSVVSSWMVGIKQLIFYVNVKADLLNLDKEEST